MSLRVWVRKESPLAPFSLPARHGSGHRPWLHRLPAPERPQVPSGPSLAEAKRGTSQPLPASVSERIFCARPTPWARALATPAACECDAQGRRRVAAATRRRRKARRGHSHGRRRVSGGSAGSGGEGLPRPAEAPGSRPPAAPVSAGADHRQPLRPPSKDCPGQFQPHTRGVAVARPEPTRVCPVVHLSVANSERPPRLAAPASATSRTQRRQPAPASQQAVTSRMGPCFSSRTIRAPPLPAIFLGGHLQRLRGDFLCWY